MPGTGDQRSPLLCQSFASLQFWAHFSLGSMQGGAEGVVVPKGCYSSA